MAITKEKMREVEDTVYDLHEHVPVLYSLCKLALSTNKKGFVVELGTGNKAYGTIPLLRACQEMGAELYSTDNSQKPPEWITHEEGTFFFDEDSVALGKKWKAGGVVVDFIFVDTSHAKGQTDAEIAVWWPLLKKGGMMAFHDTISYPAVLISMLEYFGRERNSLVYNLKNCNGLGVVIKT